MRRRFRWISMIMLSLLCAAGRVYGAGTPENGSSLNDQIKRTVELMAQSAKGQKMTIAVGRITYGDTETVSNLSAYLKNAIIDTMRRQFSGAFQVAGAADTAKLAVASRGLTVEPTEPTPIQAVVEGNFVPVDSGNVKVSLQLVSVSSNEVVFCTADFVLPISELNQNQLSILPEISEAEFEEKQEAVEVYSSQDNRFTFSVTPDDLDGIYYDGEYMTMRIYSERDCYFRITHVDVNGKSQVIYPTVASDNNRIGAGEIRKIPDNTRYRMGSPYGEEYILVAAYDKPFMVKPEPAAQISPKGIQKGLYVEPAAGGQSEMSPIATAKFNYTILPK